VQVLGRRDTILPAVVGMSCSSPRDIVVCATQGGTASVATPFIGEAQGFRIEMTGQPKHTAVTSLHAQDSVKRKWHSCHGQWVAAIRPCGGRSTMPAIYWSSTDFWNGTAQWVGRVPKAEGPWAGCQGLNGTSGLERPTMGPLFPPSPLCRCRYQAVVRTWQDNGMVPCRGFQKRIRCNDSGPTVGSPKAVTARCTVHGSILRGKPFSCKSHM
jgi:hypothetical protein